MTSKTLTISMPETLFNYLEADKELSASKIFQTALTNIIENRENIKERLRATEKLLKEKEDFIVQTNKLKEFNDWQSKNVG